MLSNYGYCEDCFYWVVDKPEYLHELGQCRRYPPKGITECLSRFPATAKKCFCGEFKRAIKQKGGD